MNKYSATKRAHLCIILSFHFIILFNVVPPRSLSISFSNVNLQPGLALMVDYMIIFKFHVHMEWKFQLGLFKPWLNFCSFIVMRFLNIIVILFLNCCRLPCEMKSHHSRFNELEFHPRLKISIKATPAKQFLQEWLTIFAKGSILDVWLGSECASVVCMIIIPLQSFRYNFVCYFFWISAVI